jgi:hypothetical protein
MLKNISTQNVHDAESAEKFVTANFPTTQQTSTYYSLQGLSQKGTKT